VVVIEPSGNPAAIKPTGEGKGAPPVESSGNPAAAKPTGQGKGARAAAWRA